MKRRDFLRTSALGTAGALGITTAGYGIVRPKEERKIIYRTLGKTGLNLPIISMGVMRSENPNLVKAALRGGIVHLDSAHVYHGGRNEVMLGKLLKDYPRDSFVISTKAKGNGMDHDTGEFTSQFSADKFMETFNISMERLDMDYVDIFYLHSQNNRKAVLYEPVMKVIDQIKSGGRARFIGVSTHSKEPEVIRAVAESDFYDIVLTSVNFHQDHYPEIRKAIAEAADKGIGIIGMKTMAGGYLDKERTQKVNGKAAMKFVLMDENVHTSIPGFTTFEELEEGLSLMEDIALTEEEIEYIDVHKSQGSLYCNGCWNCVKNCKKKLPIPDIMRSYMYAYGYGHTRHAQELLSTLNLPDDPCSGCTECTANCIKDFDIPGKIRDINRLREVPEEFLV